MTIHIIPTHFLLQFGYANMYTVTWSPRLGMYIHKYPSQVAYGYNSG